MYLVVDTSGQSFGPAPIETLRQWAIERRLTPDMTVIDQTTGSQGLAADMLLGMAVFLDPIPPEEPSTPIQPVSYAFKGSDDPGQPPTLHSRASAFFIDFLFGMMVYGALHALFGMLFVRFEYTAWSIFGYLDYLFIPMVAIYFVLRDAVFPSQSIGKRIARLKVVTSKGKPISAIHSILRNITAAPIALLPFAFLNYLAIVLLIVGFIAECFMVMTQGRRIGDHLAHTTVVNR